MSTDKEKWIDNALGSTQSMSRAGGNPFIYEKIMFRLRQRETAGMRDAVSIFKPRWALVAVFVLAINSVSVVHFVTKTKHDAIVNTSVPVELGAETIYSY